MNQKQTDVSDVLTARPGFGFQRGKGQLLFTALFARLNLKKEHKCNVQLNIIYIKPYLMKELNN